MTHASSSSGPLDWTATEERLERIAPKLEEVRREAGDAATTPLFAILADDQRDAEARRDQLSTALMEIYRLHSSRAAFACLYELNAAQLHQQVVSRLRRYRCRAYELGHDCDQTSIPADDAEDQVVAALMSLGGAERLA